MAENTETMNAEKAVDELKDNMQEIPQSMRAFSLGMRALYAEKEVSSQAEGGREFNQLRDDTKRDALVYINGILPVSTTLVRSISEFFEYYEELEMNEWKESLTDIIQEVKGYKQCCEEVVHLHEDILSSLKKRQDQAKMLLIKLGTLSDEYEKKKKELEEKASSKKAWAWGLMLIPGVNIIATPMLLRESEKATAEAIASDFQCSINGAAALVVSDTMIPALESFISGIEKVAGFFAVVEQELTTFQNKGEKAKDRAIKLHYTMMKKKAASISGSCKAFFAMVPGVRSDFFAIPDTPSDQNYVDEWLAKKQKEITKKYEHRITGQLSKMMSYFTRNAAVEMISQYAEDDEM